MEEPLVPPGNPLRLRSLTYLLAGLAGLVVLMASDAHLRLSVPLGLLAALLATFGALDFTGCFDELAGSGPATPLPAAFQVRSLWLIAALLAWLGSLCAAVAGVLPLHAFMAPLLVTLTSLGGVVALAGWLSCFNTTAGVRLRHRPGFWLMLLGVGLYVPWLGSYSLLDPWETHYGEVAREMLARDDWLSFWWAQDGWFWSKPALDFWLQGLFFSLLGVQFQPDRMLASVAEGRLPQPEWAARLPVVLLSLVAVYLLYRFVAAAAGRRAGLLSGIVLLCAPYWSLLSHQSMTDMPYVAPLTAGLALFGLALLQAPESQVGSWELVLFGRSLRLSAFHVLFGVVLLTALPQLAYLLSRNVTLQIAGPPYGFRWHWDELFSGSGMGNCGLPGNEACHSAQPSNHMFQPALGALIFGTAIGYLLHLNRGERRGKRLLYLAAWYCVALAALAKGAPGFVLPVAVAGAVLVARRDWAELTRVELAGFGLMFAGVCLPWYVQEYMRHGEPFTDRLLSHDMYKRAFVHVHDTNSGSDVSVGYYIWQLGYGLFPWSGLALAGLGLTLQKTFEPTGRVRELAIVATIWLTVGFSLFTLSLTKFHHYALPCVPPLAIAAGLMLDRALGDTPLGTLKARLSFLPPRDTALGVLAILAALTTLLVARDLSTTVSGDVPASARLLHLVTYNYKRLWPTTLDFEAVQWAFGAIAAAGLLLLVTRLRAHGAALLVAVGIAFGAFTLFVYLPRLAPHYGQRELFVAYYAARRSADEPIVAYQLNWKGENFYTSNRLPAFVSSGQKFENWLSKLQKRGAKVVFFVTEHGRVGTLKGELGQRARVQKLTDKQLNNKFALVRAELSKHAIEEESEVE